MHVDASEAHVHDHGPAPGREDGAPPVVEVDRQVVDVSAETSRRIGCDASAVVMRHASDGSMLDVGRRTRIVPTPTRRALVTRDGGCRFPGCTARHCDAHHIEHWADGGATSLDNLVLLCRRHHRLVHEGGVSVVRHANGAISVLRADGTSIDQAAPLVPVGPNALQAMDVDDIPVWDGTRFDLAWALDVAGPWA